MPPVHRLEVNAADLTQAMRLLAAAKSRGTYLYLSFNGTELELRRGQTKARLPARGDWPQTARTSATVTGHILRRSKAPSGLLEIVGSRNALHFSHYIVPCVWS
jgi:hypothetical protein